MLLIDTVLQKIVRARQVRAVMETNQLFRRDTFGLLGACHGEWPKSMLLG
jgi:hypothetical protein